MTTTPANAPKDADILAKFGITSMWKVFIFLLNIHECYANDHIEVADIYFFLGLGLDEFACAICKYCLKDFTGCSSEGTSHLQRHLLSCEESPLFQETNEGNKKNGSSRKNSCQPT